ncbi:MAG TPA: small multi-drug export protein [Candidatus Fimivicinus intestinavium]|nr:small multi-drug export protein [Candidatus Fimivicinus intestinavium]
MAETLAQYFVDFLQNKIPNELIVFIVSLFPVLELRGGMIVAKLLDVPFLSAFIISFIGNMVPIPFILLFIKKIFAWLRRFPRWSRIIDKLEARSMNKSDKIEKYKEWGLLIFVAIPLPGTGGWTGSLIAALLDLRIKKSLPIIALGVLVAGIIMSLVVYGVFGGLAKLFA